ncbi:uncharacterized protein LOC111366585 [Olea europaea var. sylvestris]|uniref:uncharacterized protein LOC111366585 n=1 Tax=Olea europaea var. sylvestris TaxID=158386 RepID=UPI000C1CEEDC|nr:uncharacterized protein LOC111366585 [Olea europaea var. sylvestris]
MTHKYIDFSLFSYLLSALNLNSLKFSEANQMTNITKLEFVAFHISGKIYLSSVLDTDVHLVSKDFRETIKKGNKKFLQDHAKTLIFLRRYLHDGLKIEYLIKKDPQSSPEARYEWMHFRLQDFGTINEYNFELFRICSKLILCGEKITDKVFLQQ